MSATLDGATPTLADVIKAAIESRLIDLHTAIPAIVASYDSARQTVTARPALKRAIQANDGSKVLEDLPQIPDVPVMWPRAGGYYMHMPIAAGDFVLLVFTERAHGEFRALGDVVDPGDQRPHGLSGAVAIPGFFPDSAPLASADISGGMSLGSAGGLQIRFGNTDIKLGSAAASMHVSLAEKIDAVVSAIVGTVIVPNDGGAAIKAAVAAAWSGVGSSSAAQKVKAE